MYYLNVKLEVNVCPKIVSLTEEGCKSSSTTFQQSKQVELNELGSAYSKSFEELKTLFSAKFKYLVKFSDKVNIEFEKMIEKLNINEQQ